MEKGSYSFKKPLYSPKEFLESGMFPGGRNALYNMLHRADFPKIRVGSKYYIPIEAYLRWIDEQSKPTAR